MEKTANFEKSKKIGVFLMKKCHFFAFLMVFCALSCFLCGCDSGTMVMSGHISEITSALSTDYAIKVTLDDDERVEDKSAGLQIMSSVEGVQVTFGEELGEDYVLNFEKADYWYNLTYLISKSSGTETEGGYLSYTDYGSRVFRFSADESATLKFRMVVGKAKTNTETGEEILVLTEPISQEVSVDMKKKEK